MNKRLAGLIVAVGALAITAPSFAADSYTGLATPIPTAAPLRAEVTGSGPVSFPQVMTIQYYGHHDRYYHRPVYYHHYHHYYRHHGVRIGPVVIR